MFLALREMRRAKVRFGLLISAIGLLVLLILAQQAIQSGLITSFVGAIERQSAPVLVYSVDGQRTLQGSVVTPPLEQRIRSTEGIAKSGRIGQGTFTVRPSLSRRGACRRARGRRSAATTASSSVTGSRCSDPEARPQALHVSRSWASPKTHSYR
jgi:hypothetical protein